MSETTQEGINPATDSYPALLEKLADVYALHGAEAGGCGCEYCRGRADTFCGTAKRLSNLASLLPEWRQFMVDAQNHMGRLERHTDEQKVAIRNCLAVLVEAWDREFASTPAPKPAP